MLVRLLFTQMILWLFSFHVNGQCGYSFLFFNTQPPSGCTGCTSGVSQLGDKRVTIKWVTLTETSLLRSFEVERSLDGSNFSSIGTVAKQGSSSYNQYEFIEDFPCYMSSASATQFYRIRIVTDNGFCYTPLVSITLNGCTTTTPLNCTKTIINGNRYICNANATETTFELVNAPSSVTWTTSPTTNATVVSTPPYGVVTKVNGGKYWLTATSGICTTTILASFDPPLLEHVGIQNTFNAEEYWCTSNAYNSFSLDFDDTELVFEIQILSWPSMSLVSTMQAGEGGENQINFMPEVGWYILRFRPLNACFDGWLEWEVEAVDCSILSYNAENSIADIHILDSTISDTAMVIKKEPNIFKIKGDDNNGKDKINVYAQKEQDQKVLSNLASTGFELYPNPATGGLVKVKLNNNEKNGQHVKFTLREIATGKAVGTWVKQLTGKAIIELDYTNHNIKKGLFILEILVGNEKTTHKLLIH